MSERIEETKLIDVLASKVWSGTKWYYPHIEAMIAELARLRHENATMRSAMLRQRQSHESLAGLFHAELTPSGKDACKAQCEKYAAEARVFTESENP